MEDQGEGFNWRDRIDQPLDLEGSQERGRGIAMTRICAEKLFSVSTSCRWPFVKEF